jgi:hypothetical protein
MLNGRSAANVVLMGLACFVLGGCASTANFSNTPKEASAFTKSRAELERDYSDIQKYDRVFASPTDSPSAEELVKLWGEPSAKRRYWGGYALGFGAGLALVAAGYATYPVIAVAYLISPRSAEEYIWQKGNYEIAAVSRGDAVVRYEQRISRWKWKEIRADERNVARNKQGVEQDGKQQISLAVEAPK